MADPNDEIRPEDRAVFGAGVVRHPVTGQLLETGIGAASPERQAQNYCDELERAGNKTAADEMRKKLADAVKFAAEAKAIAADGVTAAAARAAGELRR